MTQLYYEIHGAPDAARPPLVLLHGGGDTIATSFGAILPELAKHRRVIAFEQRGYGHSADIAGRPFTFEHSADDTAALLDELRIAQAGLFGFSNGGTIAVQVAIRHPKRVRRLVLASAPLQRSGMIAVAPHPERGRPRPQRAGVPARSPDTSPSETLRDCGRDARAPLNAA